MKDRLNFSPQPFSPDRGVLPLLWAANLILFVGLIAAGFWWYRLRDANFSVHQDIGALEQEQKDMNRRNEGLLRELESIDLKIYRKQSERFHGIQNAWRAHWGRLLDDLGGMLPEDVRIVRLAPGGSMAKADNDATLMTLSALARNKEAQLDFIRALQNQAHFTDVRFLNETYGEDGVAVSFEIRFTHRPAGGGS